MDRGALRGRSNGEQRRAQKHGACSTEHTEPARPAGLLQFIKQKKAPKMPRRLLVFHRGKATPSPMSRTAKMVIVLATAHRQPASTAQTIKCGACCASARICDIPRM